MTSRLLFLLPLLVAQARPLPAQDLRGRAREVVERAVDAVRHDSGAVLAREWSRRASGRGTDARLAQLGLATIARRQFRHAEVDTRMAALEAPPVDAITTHAWIGHAASLLTRWRPAEAAGLLERARQLARSTGDSLGEAEALMVMAPAVWRTAGPDSARVLLRRAGELVPARSRQAAQRACAEGGLLRGAALRLADSLVTDGLAVARTLGDTLGTARCLVTKGIILEAQGRISLADDPMREAISLLYEAKDFEGAGSAQQWIAYTLVTYASEFGEGRRMAERAIQNGERAGSPIVVAWARLNLAQATLRVGDVVSGLRAAREARETFARIGDPQGEMAVLGITAEAYMLSGQVEEAVRQLQEQRDVALRLGIRNGIPAIMLRLAAAETELGHVDRAERLVDSAVTLATAARIVGITGTSQHYWRGLIELKRGNADRAIERFQQFKRGVGPTAWHLNLDADLRIAEAHALARRFVEAESVFTRGSASLDEMRREAGERDDALRLLSGLRYDTDTDLGIATIVAAFATAGRLDGAFAIAEAERARWLWILRSRRDAMASARAGRHPLTERMLDVMDVRQRLDSETAVVAYVTGRGGEPTTAFAIWRDGARSAVLPPIDSLKGNIARLTSLLSGGVAAPALARTLGAQLLDAVVRALPPGVRRLRVVPDGPLHHLPFDALVLADGRRVLQRYVVSSAPSVRLAVLPSGAGAGRVVAYGDAVFDSRFGLPRLPGSAEEVEAVVRATGGRGEARLRAAARASTLRDGSLAGTGALHLATHARVEDWGMLGTAIYLGAGPGEDGRIGVEDLASMSLGVGLVVLSGCRTVGGMVTTGEGVQGLVSPILEAGAGAVAVTHWDIRDRSLIPLMADLYADLARGARADDALASAKRRSLARGDAPSVWAAVSLVGDPTVRPLATSGTRPGAAGPPSAPTSRRRAAR